MRGRPRSKETKRKVLAAAKALFDQRGLRGVTMEAIAAKAGAGKVTLYRWWPNPAVIVMDAMLADARRAAAAPETGSPLEDLRLQHRGFARVLARKREGRLIASLLGEAQLDPVVHRNFLEHWILPRRDDMKRHLSAAMEAKEAPRQVDVEAFLDALYGPLFLRLQGKLFPVTEEFADQVWHAAMVGFLGKLAHRHSKPRMVHHAGEPRPTTPHEGAPAAPGLDVRHRSLCR